MYNLNVSMRIWTSAFFLCGSALVWGQAQSPGNGVEVSSQVKRDLSPPLRTIHPEVDTRPPHEKFRGSIRPNGPVSTSPDAAVQFAGGRLVSTQSGLNLLGVGSGFFGPAGAFTVNAPPSGSHGAVCATQFVERVNRAFSGIDKAT